MEGHKRVFFFFLCLRGRRQRRRGVVQVQHQRRAATKVARTLVQVLKKQKKKKRRKKERKKERESQSMSLLDKISASCLPSNGERERGGGEEVLFSFLRRLFQTPSVLTMRFIVMSSFPLISSWRSFPFFCAAPPLSPAVRCAPWAL